MGPSSSAPGWRYFLVGIYQPPPTSDDDKPLLGEAKPKTAWAYTRWLMSKNPEEVLRAVQEIIAAIDAAHGCKSVFRVHSDRGGEFDNNTLRGWLANQGVRYTTTEGHDPSGNGQAESFIGKLKQRARAMLSLSNLDTSFWPFAVSHACLLTRFRAMGRQVPADMRIFGQKVLARRKAEVADDFLPRALEAIFLGISETVSGGQVVMYSSGRIDVNSVSYEAIDVDLDGSSPSPAEKQAEKEKQQVEKSNLDLQGEAVEAAEQLLDLDKNFDSIGDQPWLCPACRGKRRGHTKVPGQCRLADDRLDGPKPEEEIEKQDNKELDDLQEELRQQAPAQGSTPKAPTTEYLLRLLRRRALADEMPTGTMPAQQPMPTPTAPPQAMQPTMPSNMPWSTATRGQFPWTEAILQPTMPSRKPISPLAPQLPDEMLDWFCNNLLQEKLTREYRKQVVAATVAQQPQEEDDLNDDTLEKVKREMKETGMDLKTQKEVKATVGPEQVEWTQALEAELNSLKHMGVYTAARRGDLRNMEGNWEVIPSKIVWGIKSPDANGHRRKKARLVCCGNFEKKVKEETVYTSLMDATNLRVLVKTAADRKWSMGKLDIKTAFLNADLRRIYENDTTGNAKKIAVMPPPYLVQLGLAESDEIWLLDKALYGLRVAPRAWELERDAQLKPTSWKHKGQTLWLKQLASDPSIWTVMQGTGEDATIVGILGVYVDDLLALGPMDIVKSVLSHISQMWKTTEAEFLLYGRPGRLVFLGITIEVKNDKNSSGYNMNQHEFITELLANWGMSEAKGSENLRDDDTRGKEARDTAKTEADHMLGCSLETPEEEEKSIEEIRKAQAIGGALNWLATRTRPDIAFAVSRIASLSTVAPKAAVALAKRVLRLLITTQNEGLDMLTETYDDNHNTKLNTYCDASFAPYGVTSYTGIVILLGSAPVAWRASKQAMVSQSTAEAELQALAQGLQLTMGIKEVLSDIGLHIVYHMFGDNQAANSLARNGGTWRSRHFSVKAHALRQAINLGWVILHFCSTKEQKADLLTKLLAAHDARRLRQLTGMGPRPTPTTTTSPASTAGTTALAMALTRNLFADDADDPLPTMPAGFLLSHHSSKLFELPSDRALEEMPAQEAVVRILR